MTVDTTIRFVMDLLKGSPTIREMVNDKIIAEIPRVDMVLDGTNKTVVGVSVNSSMQQSYFNSQIRGYIKNEVNAQVTVLSGNGKTDQYCRDVVREVKEILQDAQYLGSYRIFINSVKDEVKSDGSVGKWMGNLILDITRFDPI